MKCDRCHKIIGSGWEEGWPIHGWIHLGASSQAFAKLCGVKGCASDEHFAIWKEGHPAMVKNGAQEVEFKWGGKEVYSLCSECHYKLMAAVGDFFGLRARAEEIRKELDKKMKPKEPEYKGLSSSDIPDVVKIQTEIPPYTRYLPIQLADLQLEIGEWEQRNFGDQPAWRPLLGVVEEVGELSHGYLKMTQGIRGTPEQHEAEIDDAVGDIMIYLMNFCTRTGRRIDVCLAKAWDHVSKRNWLAGMPKCDECGEPIPLADLIRVGDVGVVHQRCVDKFVADHQPKQK